MGQTEFKRLHEEMFYGNTRLDAAVERLELATRLETAAKQALQEAETAFLNRRMTRGSFVDCYEAWTNTASTKARAEKALAMAHGAMR